MKLIKVILYVVMLAMTFAIQEVLNRWYDLKALSFAAIYMWVVLIIVLICGLTMGVLQKFYEEDVRNELNLEDKPMTIIILKNLIDWKIIKWLIFWPFLRMWEEPKSFSPYPGLLIFYLIFTPWITMAYQMF